MVALVRPGVSLAAGMQGWVGLIQTTAKTDGIELSKTKNNEQFSTYE